VEFSERVKRNSDAQLEFHSRPLHRSKSEICQSTIASTEAAAEEFEGKPWSHEGGGRHTNGRGNESAERQEEQEDDTHLHTGLPFLPRRAMAVFLNLPCRRGIAPVGFCFSLFPGLRQKANGRRVKGNDEWKVGVHWGVCVVSLRVCVVRAGEWRQCVPVGTTIRWPASTAKEQASNHDRTHRERNRGRRTIVKPATLLLRCLTRVLVAFFSVEHSGR
jgi:hypothetical protein